MISPKMPRWIFNLSVYEMSELLWKNEEIYYHFLYFITPKEYYDIINFDWVLDD